MLLPGLSMTPDSTRAASVVETRLTSDATCRRWNVDPRAIIRKPSQPRQGFDDLVRNGVAQDREFRRHAELLEGQHGDRRPPAQVARWHGDGTVPSRSRGRMCRRRGCHLGEEAEVSPMNRADRGLSHAVVAERPAGRADTAGDARVGDGFALPDRGDDFVLRDHVITVADQMDE